MFVSSFFYDNDLSALMENFYTLTKIRIVLFDSAVQRNPVLSLRRPFVLLADAHQRRIWRFMQNQRPDFVRKMLQNPCALRLTNAMPGLIEATSPIIQNGAIIGYIMFGQITDIKDKDEADSFVNTLLKDYPLSVPMPGKLKKLKYKSQKQIFAAARILDACTSYIILKGMITPQSEHILELLSNYVDMHLSEAITVDDLCKAFNISRTQLYEETKQYTNGIASFIRLKRLTKAKELVLKTDMPISDIADSVGFSDYNYFLRVFKKHYGVSPKKMKAAGKRL